MGIRLPMEYFKKNIWNLCSFISGMLLTLSFSPFDYSYLAILSLVILFLSWDQSSPWKAAIRGYLFGLGLFATGVYWVYISINKFGGGGLVLSFLLTSIFVGFWALFPAIAGYCSVRYFPASWLRTLIIYPAIWILIEYFRGHFIFNGFPWFQVAYSQLDTPLAGYIPVFGVYGVGWLVAVIASLIILFIKGSGRQSALPMIVIFILILIGSFLNNIEWTQIKGSAIKVTLIQGNISQDKKWQPEHRKRILSMYKEITRRHWDSQIIIWPESSVPAFLHQVNEDYLRPLEMEAKDQKTDLIISLPIKREDSKKFNAVITRGQQSAEYHKIHLLPFGEYLPSQLLFQSLLGSLKTLPVGSFTAGKHDQPLMEAAGYPFIVTICYEDAFGEEGLRFISKAAYLVNVTNDGWFGRSIEPYQHMQIARMRAIETGRYLLRATNNGVTGFVSPKGKIIKQAPLFVETAITDEIYPMTGLTPYAINGDRPVIYALIVLIFIYFFYSRRKLQ